MITAHEHEASVVSELQNHEGTSATVVLDNGKKWKANTETADGV